MLGIAVSGCTSLQQNNINATVLPDSAGGTGIIAGSVTAPPVYHYHDDAYFYYRPADNKVGQAGVITSGGRHPVVTPWLPACDAQQGLEAECGRLFAIELAAGRYEIHRARFDQTSVDWEQPATFDVLAGAVSYLGNIHVSYCDGMPGTTRGAILGADISITDKSARDLSLLRTRFEALAFGEIDSKVLPNPAWNYRVAYSPHDWGSCLAK